MSGRADLRMSRVEAMGFLASESVACVAGQGREGLTARRGRYQVAGDDLVVELDPPDRCFDLERQSNVCVSVDVYPSHDEIKGVVAHGPASWVGPASLAVRIERVVSFDFSKGAT